MEDPASGRTNRMRAARALGHTPEPGEEAVAALRALSDARGSDGLAEAATLSLGAAGKTLRRADPERYAELRDDLVRRADAARAPGEAAAALFALGNTHDPDVAPALAARLADSAPGTRAAAAHALSKLGGAKESDLLGQRLAVEESALVRRTIATSLGALPSPSAATLALVNEAVTQEHNPETRSAMVKLLGEHLEAFPPARATLAALVTRDPSRSIREYATHVVWGRRAPALEARTYRPGR